MWIWKPAIGLDVYMSVRVTSPALVKAPVWQHHSRLMPDVPFAGT